MSTFEDSAAEEVERIEHRELMEGVLRLSNTVENLTKATIVVGDRYHPAAHSTYQTPTNGEFEERGTEEQIAKLYGALAKARGEFGPISRSRKVEIKAKDNNRVLYNFEYAPMEELLAATTSALSKHGLFVSMPFTCRETQCFQNVIVAHEAGGRLVYKFAFEASGDEKQFGGQTTYLQRYCYRSVLSLAADGDLDDQPTRSNEGSAEAGPRQAQHRQQAAQPQVSRNPQTPPRQEAPAAGSLEGRRREMLDAARAAGLSKVQQLAAFIYDAVSNGEPFALGEPFCSALTGEQIDKVCEALVRRRAGKP